ncbi:hypothetical protein J2S00_000237 [Caldalkalibacillus uzonensis]|uniref:Uncharacterized protein n=1 Tax=Caldalkalibacillus uzonensis TaxID=353224 RepID=A0ABU0CMT4_9BACI|nr:hypothetical protein [Caldalkalibacillus uzonensis]MDQ0337467.1 hypothetical protein [Caldalkalibacillus uzonensis]
MYKIFIQCELVGGVAESGLETQNVRFCGEHELPPLSVERTPHPS